MGNSEIKNAVEKYVKLCLNNKKLRQDLPAVADSTGSTHSMNSGQAKLTAGKPFDFTQGHESFDLAQDPEALEGPRRMASLFFPEHAPSPDSDSRSPFPFDPSASSGQA